eukprot:scaffold55982_cov60-Attheya_sp.AAC.2
MGRDAPHSKATAHGLTEEETAEILAAQNGWHALFAIDKRSAKTLPRAARLLTRRPLRKG